MKKTQKIHRKTKSSKIRKTRKLQNGGLRNPLKMFKSWREKKRGTHTLTHGEPVVTYNPAFYGRHRENAAKAMREYHSLSGYEGSNHEPKGEIVYEGPISTYVRENKEISGPYTKVKLNSSAIKRKRAKNQNLSTKKPSQKLRVGGRFIRFSS
jgi:hypothetical protein